MQWWVGRGIYTEEKPGVRCLGTGVTEDSLGLQKDRFHIGFTLVAEPLKQGARCVWGFRVTLDWW